METVGLWQLAEEQQPYMTAMRRLFHTEPELSGREFKTRETLCKELTDMGIPYTLLPGTGLIAQVKGRLPGPSRLLRSDMDALPLEELPDNPVQAKVCVSRNRGVCHACGHDAHMAMLLGTLRVLSAMREELHGTVSACFEEGEETNCGLPAMMTALDGMKIDECFALHVYSGLEAGKICLTSGPRTAGAVRFDLTFKGRAPAGSGGKPHHSGSAHGGGTGFPAAKPAGSGCGGNAGVVPIPGRRYLECHSGNSGAVRQRPVFSASGRGTGVEPDSQCRRRHSCTPWLHGGI